MHGKSLNLIVSGVKLRFFFQENNEENTGLEMSRRLKYPKIYPGICGKECCSYLFLVLQQSKLVFLIIYIVFDSSQRYEDDRQLKNTMNKYLVLCGAILCWNAIACKIVVNYNLNIILLSSNAKAKSPLTRQ